MSVLGSAIRSGGPADGEASDQGAGVLVADGDGQAAAVGTQLAALAGDAGGGDLAEFGVQFGTTDDGVFGEAAKVPDHRPPVGLVGEQQFAQRGRVKVAGEDYLVARWVVAVRVHEYETAGGERGEVDAPPDVAAQMADNGAYGRRWAGVGGSGQPGGPAAERAKPRRSGSRTRYSSPTSRFSSRYVVAGGSLRAAEISFAVTPGPAATTSSMIASVLRRARGCRPGSGEGSMPEVICRCHPARQPPTSRRTPRYRTGWPAGAAATSRTTPARPGRGGRRRTGRGRSR